MGSSEEVALELEKLGFSVRIWLAHSWAFEVEDEAPSSVRMAVALEEERAWATDHPRELHGDLELADGSEIIVFGYGAKSLEDLTFIRLYSDEHELELTLDQVKELL